MRKWRLVVRAVAAAIVISVVVVSFYPPVLYHVWGYRTTEVDVRSGRLRERLYAFGLLVSDRTVETEFSRWAVDLSLVQTPPLWRRAGESTGGFAYGHFVCGGHGKARVLCKYLVLYEDCEGADRARRREDIAQFLQLMQSGDLDEMQRIINERGKALNRAAEAAQQESSELPENVGRSVGGLEYAGI